MNSRHIKEVCKLGKGHECCRYLVCDGEGFQCAKHIEGLKDQLDERANNGRMTARADNCDGLPPEFRELHQNIFDNVVEMKPDWKNNPDTLRAIILMSVRHNDKYKRVIVGGKIYLVPIADIICTGIKAEDVPAKYKEA